MKTKVPNYIISKMRRAVNAYRRGAELMREIEGWLEKSGVDIDGLRDGNGESLEEIEYGNDVVDLLIARIEGLPEARE